ncbi:peptidylprolyl isomerase [Clostridiales bacterium FE2011]|nr:peptidylprolyl isomerase [Clostridiales bacterium FE2011]
MMKRLFCILLSLVMLMSVSFALAEDTADAAAEAETAEVISDEPVLLVTVNGQEIQSDNDYLLYMQSNYLNWASSSGYDTSDASLITAVNQQSLYDTIGYFLVLQKGKELGLDQFTDDDKAAFAATAKEQWEEIVNSFVSANEANTEDSSDEDKAAARADAEAQLLSDYGYDEARYIKEYGDQAVNNTIYQRVTDHLSKDLKVTDEDIQTYFDDLVKDDQEIYENDAGSYEFYTRYYGQPSYYMPAGYRGITHILLKVDDELLNTWKDLSARLEEQKSAAEEAAEATPAADAEPTAEPEPTEEPVTEEMVSNAKQAILDSVKATVDEIKAKLDGGATFEDLIKEYGTDPGMEDAATLAEGYPVHNDSILYDPAFKDAAMALEKVGDISDPVVGQYGVHILQYLRDVPSGAVELTDEMKDEFRATILQEMITETVHSAVDQWMEEAEIVYTEAGEPWKAPVDDEGDAEEAAEAPAEEAAETPAE